MTSERSEQPREFSLWSFLRSVLSQGAGIHLDHRGKGYEFYSARLDEAAREREDELARRLQPARVPEGWQLVPTRPTPEMLEQFRRPKVPGLTLGDRYARMLAAAPAAEGGMADGAICPNCERITSIHHCQACGADFIPSARPAPPPAEPVKCNDCGAPEGERCRNRIGNDGEGGFYFMCSRALEKPGDGGREGVEALSSIARDEYEVHRGAGATDEQAWHAAFDIAIRHLASEQQSGCRAHACKRIRIEMQAEIDRLRGQPTQRGGEGA